MDVSCVFNGNLCAAKPRLIWIGEVSPACVLTQINNRIRRARRISADRNPFLTIGNHYVIVDDRLRGIGPRDAALTAIERVENNSFAVRWRSAGTLSGIEIAVRKVSSDIDMGPRGRVRLNRLVDTYSACACITSLRRIVGYASYHCDVINARIPLISRGKPALRTSIGYVIGEDNVMNLCGSRYLDGL